MKALAAAVLLALPALAAGTAPTAADCECIGNGVKYHQGELACLRLPSGAILARCDKVLNNSSWTKVGDGCPQASAGSAAPEDVGHRHRAGWRRPFLGLLSWFEG